ncbi:Di-sulfide bridge nucleocytoplasmic transport domain-containing protein [Pilobolus umbonatus]|nr:Di-sulfide bridge nucleocytoplasmic transport domain-containing protein [Pilobolus umbonatus]
MGYEYSDDMEFEYTHPQSIYPKSPKEEDSLRMEEDEVIDNAVTEGVCDLLTHVQLEDITPEIETPEEVIGEEEEEASDERNEEEAVVLYRGPLSPPRSPSTETPSLSPPSKTATENLLSVSPEDTPKSIPSPSTHTFIYQQPDPLLHSKGTIYYLSGIVRIITSSILILISLYILMQFILYLQHDIATKIANYESDILEDHFYCQQQYELNRCAPDTRLPAISSLCREWEKCIYRPLSTTKTKILAEIFAEIANAFLDTLTLKTTCFMILIVISIFWAIVRIGTRPNESKPLFIPSKVKGNVLQYEHT